MRLGNVLIDYGVLKRAVVNIGEMQSTITFTYNGKTCKENTSFTATVGDILTINIPKGSYNVYVNGSYVIGSSSKKATTYNYTITNSIDISDKQTDYYNWTYTCYITDNASWGGCERPITNGSCLINGIKYEINLGKILKDNITYITGGLPVTITIPKYTGTSSLRDFQYCVIDGTEYYANTGNDTIINIRTGDTILVYATNSIYKRADSNSNYTNVTGTATETVFGRSYYVYTYKVPVSVTNIIIKLNGVNNYGFAYITEE